MPSEPADFSNKYKIIRTIGRGGFATVKEAVNVKTGQKYACKIVQTEGSDYMLRKEDAILRRVSSGHKSILSVVDYYETADYSYLVTDLAEGGSLLEHICRKDSYNERDIARIIKTVCDGVSYLHDNGVVHRDIKPDNILVRNNDSNTDLLISDFGLARIMDASDLQELYTVCGTPCYMAPEILKKTGHGNPVDLWAIGVMTYYLLSSYAPFASDNSEKERKKITSANYNYDDPVWSHISSEAKDFIDRCLTISANERITAKEALNHRWLKQSCSSNSNRRLPNLRSPYSRSSFVPRHQMLKQPEESWFTVTNVLLVVGAFAIAALCYLKSGGKN